MKEGIEQHLEENRVIKETQHGFRRGRSCQTNMIKFFDRVMKWHDEGEAIDVVNVDFSKAFDKVNHRRLLVNVEAIGIRGKVLEFKE